MKKNRLRLTRAEGLVVLVTLVVVGGLLWFNLERSWKMQRDLRRKVNLGEIMGAIGVYAGLNDGYPISSGDFVMLACGLEGSDPCLWGQKWGDGRYVYMELMPRDERALTDLDWPDYGYRLSEDGECFEIWAFFERSDDPDVAPSHERCPGDWNENQFVGCQCR